MKPLLALFSAAALQAVTAALLGVSFSVVDSIVMLIIGAVAATVVGQIWLRRRPSLTPPTQKSHSGRSALLRLNIAGLICFGAFFLGIVVHEAPVVFALEVGFAPLTATCWSWWQSRRTAGPAPKAWQWLGAGAMATLAMAMAMVANASNPVAPGTLVLGCGLGILAGAAVATIAITSRGLGAAGFSFPYVLAHRFHATYLGAGLALGVLLVLGHVQLSLTAILVIGALALCSMVVPLVLLQFAMMQVSPVMVTAVLATVPAATAVVTVLAGGSVSWIVAGLALLIVPLSIELGRRTAASRPKPPPTAPVAGTVPAGLTSGARS